MAKERYPDLGTYFRKTKARQIDVARAAKLSQSYISLIASKGRRPSLDTALRLHHLTGVPLAGFLDRED